MTLGVCVIFLGLFSMQYAGFYLSLMNNEMQWQVTFFFAISFSTLDPCNVSGSSSWLLPMEKFHAASKSS